VIGGNIALGFCASSATLFGPGSLAAFIRAADPLWASTSFDILVSIEMLASFAIVISF
jgi:hypothetical protein